MIKKLAIKKWTNIALFVLICLGMGGGFLWRYGEAALVALSGRTPMLARKESLSNIYIGSGIGVFFVVIAIIIIVRNLNLSVHKQVDRYLTAHSEVTLEQLDSDFGSAERFGNVWIGRCWTFSYDLDRILLENDQIVWVFTESYRPSARSSTVNYNLCLGLADGKMEKVKVSEEKLAKIQEWYKKYPHILVGYNSEYEQMFNNDINALMDIKYRQKAEGFSET